MSFLSFTCSSYPVFFFPPLLFIVALVFKNSSCCESAQLSLNTTPLRMLLPCLTAAARCMRSVSCKCCLTPSTTAPLHPSSPFQHPLLLSLCPQLCLFPLCTFSFLLVHLNVMSLSSSSVVPHAQPRCTVVPMPPSRTRPHSPATHLCSTPGPLSQLTLKLRGSFLLLLLLCFPFYSLARLTKQLRAQLITGWVGGDFYFLFHK